MRPTHREAHSLACGCSEGPTFILQITSREDKNHFIKQEQLNYFKSPSPRPGNAVLAVY